MARNPTLQTHENPLNSIKFMNNDNNLQSILQRYNEKHHPYNIVDAETPKKSKSKPKRRVNKRKQHLLKERLAELNKFLSTWRNLNVITTEAERESVLNEIEQIKKELK